LLPLISASTLVVLMAIQWDSIAEEITWMWTLIALARLEPDYLYNDDGVFHDSFLVCE
jgi:hypothetical protein